MPSRRERQRPSNSCGTMTQDCKFQRQIGALFGRFRPCLIPQTFLMMLLPVRLCSIILVTPYSLKRCNSSRIHQF